MSDSTQAKVPIAVLISGRGSNMVSLVEAVKAGSLAADVRVVLSNKPTAAGLEWAAERGVPTAILSHKDFASREEFDTALANELEGRGVRYVALAGFMRVLTPAFLGRFSGRVINIHPALLPSFPGMNVQQKAIDYGVRHSGCTVHFVDEGVDTGAIIAQAVVPILDDDTADSLAARILEQEHRIYPLALDAVLSGRVRMEGRRVLGTGIE
ncbi:MAG: phosphoribosylglycinamide formyltransferase [Deltaproteobacteria bacterium]|nr:phosphoribosylglycinamide formyltransferase [Deltaproteobacteria bacterium]